MGWIIFAGDASDVGPRLGRFRRAFDAPGVPPLRVEEFSAAGGIKGFLWAWSHDELPDLHFTSDHEGNGLLLSGVITDMGSLGPAPADPGEAASRLLGLLTDQGEKFISQLNGSFSVIFHHGRSGQTRAFTDRFASRSVWMHRDRGALILGDFPSAMAAVKEGAVGLNPSGLWSLFHAGRHPGRECLFSGFECLLAGQAAEISSELKVEVRSWWERKYLPDHSRSAREWGLEIADGLSASARKYLRVCRAPHLFLSGGLDSRIAAAAIKSGLHTLSLCSSPNAETRLAGLTARTLGLAHETIVRSPYWYLDTLEASALVASGSYFKDHAHFMVPVGMALAERPGAEFFLGDLLENFNKHYFKPPPGEFRFGADNAREVLFRNVPYTQKAPGRAGRLFNPEVRERLEGEYNAAIREFADHVSAMSDDPCDRLDSFLRWADVSVTPTYNMLTCLRVLARERNICFDNELNDLSLCIPSSMRSGVLHKWILYRLSKSLAFIPDANTMLPPFFPKAAGKAAKKVRPFLGRIRRARLTKNNGQPSLKTSGSWLLTHEMYRKDDRYRSRIERTIRNPEVFPPEIFDPAEIEHVWKRFLSGDLGRLFEIEALWSYGALMERIDFQGIEFRR